MQQLLPTTQSPAVAGQKVKLLPLLQELKMLTRGATFATPWELVWRGESGRRVAGASEQLQEEARDNVDDKVPLVHGVPRL